MIANFTANLSVLYDNLLMFQTKNNYDEKVKLCIGHNDFCRHDEL